MTDLQREFRRSLDATTPPDLDGDVRERVQRASAASRPIPAGVGNVEDGRRRVIAAVTAIAVFAAAAVFVWSGFREADSPVREHRAAQGGVADVLSVRCEGEETSVSSSEVVAEPDGVHLSVVGPSGEPEMAVVDLVTELGTKPIYHVAGGEVVRGLDPGEHHVRCVGADDYVRSEDLAGVAFTVTDPNGAFIPTALACPPESQDDVDRWTTGGRGQLPDLAPDTLSAWARDVFDGIQPADEVRQAGYADAAYPSPTWIVVEREGAAIAWFLIFPSHEVIFDGMVCASSGITA